MNKWQSKVFILHWNDLEILRKSIICLDQPMQIIFYFIISPSVRNFRSFSSHFWISPLNRVLHYQQNYPQLWINWFCYVNRKAQQISSMQTITNQMHLQIFQRMKKGQKRRSREREEGGGERKEKENKTETIEWWSIVEMFSRTI